ncbi:MAG: hypothetical protein LBK67_05305 [Coriobacteriales bacterium]|nr:hypothetical protein [Coriobacteriales bacterium]
MDMYAGACGRMRVGTTAPHKATGPAVWFVLIAATCICPRHPQVREVIRRPAAFSGLSATAGSTGIAPPGSCPDTPAACDGPLAQCQLQRSGYRSV